MFLYLQHLQWVTLSLLQLSFLPIICIVLTVPSLFHILSHLTGSLKCRTLPCLSHQFSFEHLNMVLVTVLPGLMF